MAFNFPTDPQAGDTYEKYTWNGTSWAIQATGNGGGAFDGLITDLYGPTGADGMPAEKLWVVVDKGTGKVKVIEDFDYIEPE